MYKYSEKDKNIVKKRVEQFRFQVERRLNGNLSEEEFKPLRLMNGLYLQSLATVSEAGPPPIKATFLPFLCFGILGRRSTIESLLSAATRLSRQMATGSSSTRPRRHAGSQGRSQVRPRMPGNTLDSQLTM